MKRFNVSGGARKAVRQLKFVPVFLLVFVTLSFTTGVSAAELIVNGGFEEPDLATTPSLTIKGFRAGEEGWATFYGQNFSGTCTVECYFDADGNLIRIPGWSVIWTDTLGLTDEPGRLEIQNNSIDSLNPGAGVALAKGGSQKVELDSHDREGSSNNNVTISQTFDTCRNTAYSMTYQWKSRRPIQNDNNTWVIIDGYSRRTLGMNDAWTLETINFISNGTGTTTIVFASIGSATTYGMFLDNISVDGPGILECPPPPNCEDIIGDGEFACIDDSHCLCVNGELAVDKLSLTYNGGTTATSNSQDPDKYSVVPVNSEVTWPLVAYIKVMNANNPSKPSQLLFEGTVDSGQTFPYPIDTRGNMLVEIYHPNDRDNPLQTVEFHASCSQPLNFGDTFGGITITNPNP